MPDGMYTVLDLSIKRVNLAGNIEKIRICGAQLSFNIFDLYCPLPPVAGSTSVSSSALGSHCRFLR